MGSYDKDAIVRKLTNRVREKACLEVPNDYNPDDLILTTLLVLPPEARAGVDGATCSRRPAGGDVGAVRSCVRRIPSRTPAPSSSTRIT